MHNLTFEVDGCRRMEDAVKAIPESSDLCKKIVLGQNVDDIPGKFNALAFALIACSSTDRTSYLSVPLSYMKQ